MSRVTSASSRRALIIFIILAVLFCVQMGWWIVFQYRLAGNTRRFLASTLEEHKAQTIQLLNGRLATAGQAVEKVSGDLTSIRKDYSDIISGVASSESLENSDLGDSLFMIRTINGIKYYIFLDRNFPHSLMSGDDRLEYTAPRGEVSMFNWITPMHLQVSPKAYLEIEGERSSHTRMFLMEGSFFFLLIAIGGYLIFLSLKRLKQTREEQLLFVHSITHELKIPITSLSLFIDTMKRRNYDPKLGSELVPKMKEDLNRLNQLIDNILQVRRLADRQVTIRTERIDLSRELHAFGQKAKDRIEATGGRLNLNIDEKIKIEAGLPELVRVWELLLDNSLKYGKSDGLEITISLRNRKDMAEIIFSDNGPGFPPGMEEMLFEPFFRGNIEEKKTVPGSGLGLYISREYITRQGGDINIRNGSNGGAVVIMEFKVIR